MTKYESIEITELMRREATERAEKTLRKSGLYTIERWYKGFLGEGVFAHWLKNNKIGFAGMRSYGKPDDGDFTLNNGKKIDVKTGHRKTHINMLDPETFTMNTPEYQLKKQPYDYYVYVLLNANFMLGFIIGWCEGKDIKPNLPVSQLKDIYDFPQEVK